MLEGRSRVVALVTLAAASAWWIWAGTRLGCDVNGERLYALADDQLISLRYAKNLAEGHGLVWNAGQEPVEGISNLLWTLWMAVGHAIGIPASHAALWVVFSSTACLGVSAVFAAKVVGRLRPGRPWLVVGGLAAAAFYWPTARWSVHGFEVAALAACITPAAYFTLERDPEKLRLGWIGALGVIALFLRLDAAVLFGALGLHLLWRAGAPVERRRVWLWVALPCALFLVASTAWRLSYYGEWVPNTFVLKGTGVDLGTRISQGFDATWQTLQSHLAVLVMPFALAFAGPSEQRPQRRSLVWILAAQWLFVMWIGGDTWEEPNFANRQFATVMPLAMCLVVVGFAEGWELLAQHASRRLATATTITVAFIAFWLTSGRAFDKWADFDHCESMLWPKIRTAIALRDHAPPDTTVAVVWAGAVPYFSGLPSIDLLGKSDRTIARTVPHHGYAGHNKWDYRHSIGELRPHLVIDLYSATHEDMKRIASYGYRYMPDGMWYRNDFHLPGVEPKLEPQTAQFEAAPPPGTPPPSEEASP